MLSAGHALRQVRIRLGFTLEDVARASQRIAEAKSNPAYLITASRLSDIESKGVLPNVFRLYTLAAVYRLELESILGFFGVSLGEEGTNAAPPRRTSLLDQRPGAKDFSSLAGSEGRTTTLLDELKPEIPIAAINSGPGVFAYAYIGTGDFTMDPIVPPGSFLQIDKSQREVASGAYRSEHLRPIYFIETRRGYVCSWCTLLGNQLSILPHPLSPVIPRKLRYRSEAEIIGRVVAVVAPRRQAS